MSACRFAWLSKVTVLCRVHNAMRSTENDYSDATSQHGMYARGGRAMHITRLEYITPLNSTWLSTFVLKLDLHPHPPAPQNQTFTMPPTIIDLPSIRIRSWTQSSSYTVSSLISYNLALGAPGTSLPLVYESHPSFHALPSFGCVHAIAAMGSVHTALFDLIPGFVGHNHVHAAHSLRVLRAHPIPKAGGQVKLETTARITDIAARGEEGAGKGVNVLVALETRVVDSGEVLCVNEWTGAVLGVPDTGASPRVSSSSSLSSSSSSSLTSSPSSPSSSSSPLSAKPANLSSTKRKPDKILAHRTSPAQAALYRAASGDFNPLHIDPATASAAGFPAPLLTGTCTLGIGVRHVVEAFARGDAGLFMGVRARLVRPVFAALGEEVRTEMWEEEEEVGREKARRVEFRMVVRDEGKGADRVVVDGGVVVLRGGDGEAKL